MLTVTVRVVSDCTSAGVGDQMLHHHIHLSPGWVVVAAREKFLAMSIAPVLGIFGLLCVECFSEEALEAGEALGGDVPAGEGLT